jgi:hypothetical protein
MIDCRVTIGTGPALSADEAEKTRPTMRKRQQQKNLMDKSFFKALLQNFCNKKQEIEKGCLKLYG